MELTIEFILWGVWGRFKFESWFKFDSRIFLVSKKWESPWDKNENKREFLNQICNNSTAVSWVGLNEVFKYTTHLLTCDADKDRLFGSQEAFITRFQKEKKMGIKIKKAFESK